jgi:RNA polymerase sigma-70 factor, ECF subfamily
MIQMSPSSEPDLTAETLEETFARMRPVLLRAAMKILKNEADAEDSVQETAVLAWMHLRAVRDRRYLGSWLYRVNVNAALSSYRRRKRSSLPLPLTDRLPSGGASAEQTACAASVLGHVLQTLEALPAAYRQPVFLSYAEDLSYDEIGGRLGMTASLVKLRVWRGRRMIAAIMAKRRAL